MARDEPNIALELSRTRPSRSEELLIDRERDRALETTILSYNGSTGWQHKSASSFSAGWLQWPSDNSNEAIYLPPAARWHPASWSYDTVSTHGPLSTYCPPSSVFFQALFGIFQCYLVLSGDVRLCRVLFSTVRYCPLPSGTDWRCPLLFDTVRCRLLLAVTVRYCPVQSGTLIPSDTVLYQSAISTYKGLIFLVESRVCNGIWISKFLEISIGLPIYHRENNTENCFELSTTFVGIYWHFEIAWSTLT